MRVQVEWFGFPSTQSPKSEQESASCGFLSRQRCRNVKAFRA